MEIFFQQVVESDADAELLFNIPFTGNIKLKGIIVIGEDSDCHPARLRMWVATLQIIPQINSYK